MASKPSRKAQKEARPAEILDAAFAEFVANGFEGARVEDIARRLGVTKGTVYLYFDSKEALFSAMLAEHAQAMRLEFGEIAAKLTGSPRQRLEAFLSYTLKEAAQDETFRDLLALMMGECQRFPEQIRRHYAETYKHLCDICCTIIAEGRATGEFRTDTATDLSAMLVLAPGFWLSVTGALGEPMQQPEVAVVIDGLIRLLGGGLYA